MKKFILIILAVYVFPGMTYAKSKNPSPPGWTPIKIGYPTFKRDIKSFPNRQSVYGLDLGLPITITQKMAGFQVSLLVNESEKMSGIQLAGLGNKATSAYGLQIGAGGNVVDRLVGIQLSAIANNFDYNTLDTGTFHSDIIGFQIAPLTNITTTIKGIQVGAFNFSQDTSGFQIGITNRSSGVMKGIQIGLLNYCGQLKGIQIGLINRIKNRSFLKTTPIFNCSF